MFILFDLLTEQKNQFNVVMMTAASSHFIVFTITLLHACLLPDKQYFNIALDENAFFK